MRVKLQCQSVWCYILLYISCCIWVSLIIFVHAPKIFSQFESLLRSMRYGLGVELTRWRWQFHFGIMDYNALSSAPHDIFISHLFWISHSTSMLGWPSSGTVTDFWNTISIFKNWQFLTSILQCWECQLWRKQSWRFC